MTMPHLSNCQHRRCHECVKEQGERLIELQQENQDLKQKIANILKEIQNHLQQEINETQKAQTIIRDLQSSLERLN